MTPELLIALAIAVVPGLLSLAVAVVNSRKLNKLQVDVDGRLTQLLALTAVSSKAEGVLEGKNPPVKESGQ